MKKIIVVLQSSGKKQEADYFSAAISRYCKYVGNDDEFEFTSFVSKTTNNSGEYLDALLDCYKFIESEKESTKGFLFVFSYQTNVKNNKFFKSDYILSISEVLKNNKNFWKSVGELKTLIKVAMDWYYFNLVFGNFRHGQKNDIVNSELGLLKVYLDNPGTLLTNDDINLDIINKVTAYIIKLRDSINNYGYVADLKTHNTKISDNLDYTNYIIDNLIEIFKNNDIEWLKTDAPTSQNVSSDIFELFCRISFYKDFAYE